jgi:Ca2+-binding RTX toxin-like protein
MRRGRGRRTAILAVLLAVATAGPASATPNCFGRRATIVARNGNGVTINGTAGDDVIVGGAGDDTIDGRGGDDRICGLAGDDRLKGGPGVDGLNGGPDDDRLWGGANADLLNGGAGLDAASFSDSPRAVVVDLVEETAIGEGRDALAVESVVGSDFNDRLIGDDGQNRLSGGDGNDSIIAGDGDDALFGGDGNDILRGEFGDDSYDGGANAAAGDTVSYSDDPMETSGIAANISSVTAAGLSPQEIQVDSPAVFEDASRIENVIGTDETDLIVGSAGANRLEGGAGTDIMYGLGGDDRIFGGEGNDTLSGGAGSDLLDGGLHEPVDVLSNGDMVAFEDDAADLEVIADLTTGLATIGPLDGTHDTDELIGIESLRAGPAQSVLIGDSGPNLLWGGDEVDLLIGNAGNDTLLAGEDSDNLFGDHRPAPTEIDRCVRHPEITTPAAGAGNDILQGNAGLDCMAYAGGGTDSFHSEGGASVDFLHASQGVAVSLPADTACFATCLTFVGINSVWGTNFNDSFVGDDAQNIFGGRNGNDTMSGGAGFDLLDGDAGSDLANGGSEWDFCYESHTNTDCETIFNADPPP